MNLRERRLYCSTVSTSRRKLNDSKKTETRTTLRTNRPIRIPLKRTKTSRTVLEYVPLSLYFVWSWINLRLWTVWVLSCLWLHPHCIYQWVLCDNSCLWLQIHIVYINECCVTTTYRPNPRVARTRSRLFSEEEIRVDSSCNSLRTWRVRERTVVHVMMS